MRAIRSSGNKTTEMRLVGLLRANQLRGWRRHPSRRLPGKPDLLFTTDRVAVFVDGCFWHGCPKCGHIPKTNRAYWKAKIARNRDRDALMSRALRATGLRVVRLRECDLKKRPGHCLWRIRRALARSQAKPVRADMGKAQLISSAP
jgi:DNA mismatch endonuclease (patch repair protein)